MPEQRTLTEWRALRGPGMVDALMAARWYPQPNDLIGGWCVMPVDQPPSAGYPEVAETMSEDVARHIADLHNATLNDGGADGGPA